MNCRADLYHRKIPTHSDALTRPRRRYQLIFVIAAP
jgi:hypothetical protein